MQSAKARPFSERRIQKVQELRQWRAERDRLRPNAMHRIERLTRSRERGWLEWRIPPLLEAALCLRKKSSDPVEKPGFVCHSTAMLLVVLWKATIERKHSHLFVAHDQLAALLGCSLRTEQNAVYEADRADWLEIDPLYDEVHTDGRCRCEHIHASKDAPCTLCPCALHQNTWEVRCRLCKHPHGPEHSGPCSCGCRVFRPLQHRQMPNAYGPGPRLLEVAMHVAEQKGDLAGLRHWAALHGAVVARKEERRLKRAASGGNASHDPLDRNECDPSPCEGSLPDQPPPTSPDAVLKLPGTCARAPRPPKPSAAPPAAPAAPVKAPPAAPAPVVSPPPVPAAPVDPTGDRALMAEGPERARGLTAASRLVVDDARPLASTPAAWPKEGNGGSAAGGGGPPAGRPAPAAPAPLRTPADPRHQPITAADHERIARWNLDRIARHPLRPHALRDLAERMDLQQALAIEGRPADEITEALTQLHAAQQGAKWGRGGRPVCAEQPRPPESPRTGAIAEAIDQVRFLLAGSEGPEIAAALLLLAAPYPSRSDIKEAARFLDCARGGTPKILTAAALLHEAARRLGTR